MIEKKIESIQNLIFPKDARITISQTPIIEVDHSRQENYLRNDKPNGLWYGIEDSWTAWVAALMPQNLFNYIYALDIPDFNILRIKNTDDFQAFERGFKITHPNREFDTIDWCRIAQMYYGIEIMPYREDKRWESYWYRGWEVASGVVWSRFGVEKIELLYKWDDQEAIYKPVKKLALI